MKYMLLIYEDDADRVANMEDLAKAVADEGPRQQAADGAYERAIGLEADPAVRRFLQRRRAELRG